ncbi:MAG: protein translocase subunit SecD [Spirochaetes bacterium]|nr:protein translocase subunit SecD [Spirochaetota bacterium]
MSNSFRFFIIALMLGFAAWFLWPSYVYYFGVSDEARRVVESGGLANASLSNATDAFKAEVERAGKSKAGAVALGLDIRGGINIVLEADFDKYAVDSGRKPGDIDEKMKLGELERVIMKIQNRIDEYGLSEVSIRKLGFNRIVIQIPGERDTGRIKSIIDSKGQLEFRMVDEDATRTLDYNRETGELKTNGAFPPGTELFWSYHKGDRAHYVRTAPVLLKTNIDMSGEHIKDARPGQGQYGDIVVSFQLDGEGGRIFGELTGANKGKRLAIVLDQKVMSSPNINERIGGGSGQITGSFTHEEAKDLALILRSGSLPVSVKLISEEVIGPTMGWESLTLSVKALMMSLLAITLFMALRYRLKGIIAAIALGLNAILIFAILAPLKFTVSLPGIAGLILTLGMAIDANVLINERIRDEIFKEGRNIFEAIERGYSRAFWTIFDSHVTGLISAFILANMGEGPVRGFAFTLAIGLIVSLFTSLFVTRFLVDLCIKMGIIRRYSAWVV